MFRWSFGFLSVLQGEGGDGGPGGESPAAADGDNSGDAGGPAGGEHGAREEGPGGGLGRYMNTARSRWLFYNVAVRFYPKGTYSIFTYY